MIAAFVIGFVLSFVGSMPIAGPIAVIVLSRGLDKRPQSGFLIALGAAVAESVYAGLAFLGLTAMLQRYPLLVPISRLSGCAILIGLGVYFIARRPRQDPPGSADALDASSAAAATPALPSGRATTSFGSLILGLSVTALNPTLLVTWTAAVSAAQSTGLLRVAPLDVVPFAAAVGLGIVSWFTTLLALIGRFHKKVGGASVTRLIRGMGVLLLVCGVGFGLRTVLTWHVGR